MKLYSFDIFDTLITRKTASPHGIFAIMQEELVKSQKYEELPKFLRENFFELRITAEERAGSWASSRGEGDITIDDIYDVLGKAYGLDKGEQRNLIKLECQTEMENTVCIRNRAEEVFVLAEAGKRVVLISDMYLKESMIRDILVACDERFHKIPVYVSSEFKKRKDSGELYYLVRDRENVRFSEWSHTGDNQESDINVPASLGIHSKRISGKVFLPIEQYLIDRFESDAYIQRLIGNGTITRQLHDMSSVTNHRAFSYGTFYLPMIIDGYICWVLNMARKQGIKTLYFIARDGYLLKKMADLQIEKRGYPIKTKYIYGSRLTWRVPALSEENWNIKELCGSSDSMKYYAARDMAGMFGISEDSFCRFLPDDIDKDVIIGTPTKKYIAECLENNGEFKKYLLDEKYEDRWLMKEYLSQEIDVSEEFAFVELFGGGFTQYQLAKVLKEMGAEHVRNYYYHLSRDFSDQFCEFNCYLPLGHKETPVLERFFSAPHGRTTGYERDNNGRLKPILDHESEILSDYGHREMREGFEEYLKSWDTTDKEPRASVIEAFENYIKNEPDEGILEFIGDMQADASENTDDLYKYAPAIGSEELRNIYLLRGFEPISVFYSGLFFEYSWRRCGEKDKESVKELTKKKRLPGVVKEREEYLRKLGLKKKYLLQYGFLPGIKGKRVVLYGAGQFGCFLKDELDDEEDVCLVAWVDRDGKDNKSGEAEVLPIKCLMDRLFDYVIVGIMDAGVSKIVQHNLTDMGISESKILLPGFI